MPNILPRRLFCFCCGLTAAFAVYSSLSQFFFTYEAPNDIYTQQPPETTTQKPKLAFLGDGQYQCGEERRLPARKVAIIAATTPPPDKGRCIKGNSECSYAFYLPLTALAWRRLGYGTAVIIAGDEEPWKSSGHHLNFVYKTLQDLGNITVIFLPAPKHLKTGIAQVGRVFVPDMEPFSREPDTYMVTSDADLFPITNIYDLPNSRHDIQLTNGHCCDPFPHRGEQIPMVALSSVGMRVSTWHAVMNYRNISNSTDSTERVKTGLLQEFGNLPVNATRGPYDAWFRDQQIISINLHRWFSKNGNRSRCRRSDFLGRRTRWDRISWHPHQDNNRWLIGHDAHCPLPGHTETNFKALHELAQLLAGDHLDVARYWHTFMMLMGAKVSPMDNVMADLARMKNMKSSMSLHNPEWGQ